VGRAVLRVEGCPLCCPWPGPCENEGHGFTLDHQPYRLHNTLSHAEPGRLRQPLSLRRLVNRIRAGRQTRLRPTLRTVPSSSSSSQWMSTVPERVQREGEPL
jgi:hypothetical protein